MKLLNKRKNIEKKEVTNLVPVPLSKKQGVEDGARFISKELVRRMDVIGFPFKKFILCRNASVTVLIDQHAIHERIRYEYFYNKLFNFRELPFQSVFLKSSKEFSFDQLKGEDRLTQLQSFCCKNAFKFNDLIGEREA